MISTAYKKDNAWFYWLLILRWVANQDPTLLFRGLLDIKKMDGHKNPYFVMGLIDLCNDLLFNSDMEKGLKKEILTTIATILTANRSSSGKHDFSIEGKSEDRLQIINYAMELLNTYSNLPPSGNRTETNAIFEQAFHAEAPLEVKINRKISSDPAWQEAFEFYNFLEEQPTTKPVSIVKDHFHGFLSPNNSNRLLMLALRGSTSFENDLLAKYLTFQQLNRESSENEENFIPIFIPLHHLQNPLGKAIEEGLAAYGIEGEQQIEQLKKKKILWILSDFEKVKFNEINGRVQLKNIYQINNFDKWKNARCIITVTEGFCDERFIKPDFDTIERHRLDTFSTGIFLQHYLRILKNENHSDVWSYEKYKKFLDKHIKDPLFSPFFVHPFLLKMLVHRLPQIEEALESSDPTASEDLLDRRVKDICACAFVGKMLYNVQKNKKEIDAKKFIEYFIDLVKAISTSEKHLFTIDEMKKSNAFKGLVDETPEIIEMRRACLSFQNDAWAFDKAALHWVEVYKNNQIDRLKNLFLKESVQQFPKIDFSEQSKIICSKTQSGFERDLTVGVTYPVGMTKVDQEDLIRAVQQNDPIALSDQGELVTAEQQNSRVLSVNATAVHIK